MNRFPCANCTREYSTDFTEVCCLGRICITCWIDRYVQYETVPVRPFWACPICRSKLNTEVTKKIFLLALDYLSNPLINTNFPDI